MSHSEAGGATTTPSRDTMIQPSSAGPAASDLSASEEPAIFNLPVELQQTVVEYLTSYTDMKSACLVCKQLNLIVTPYLYRKMEITGEFLITDRFTATITTRHPGLPSVETVRIVCPRPSLLEIGRAACLLLSTIPRNSLTRLELPVPTSPRGARDVFNCVRRKQRNVGNYQYDSFHLNGSSEAFVADTQYRAPLKHLRLCLWDPQDYEQAGTVLDSMHELTSLDVDVRQSSFTHNHGALRLIVRAFSMDLERSSIRKLRLDGVDFAQYGDTFPELPGAQGLKHLQLVDCSNYGPFLQMLTALSLDLATLTIDEADCDYGSFDDNINDFIRSLSTLERVSLALGVDFEQTPEVLMLDWSTLHQCASVIKSLKLQYHSLLPPYPSDEKVSDFRHFCKNASRLEHLSMSGIDLPINKTSGDRDIHGSLEQFLDCVQTASALVVLKLTIWISYDTSPLSKDSGVGAHVKEAQDLAQRREHLVKRTADKIFSTLVSSCPRLKVVVIETTWAYGRDDNAVRAFLSSKQIDLYGRTTVVGMPVEPCMVKHFEPCPDILKPNRFVCI